MGIFWKKKTLNHTFDERLETLEVLVSKLKREVVSNTMDVDTLRDKVLRKLQTKRKKQEEDEKEVETGIPEDGFSDVRKLTNSIGH